MLIVGTRINRTLLLHVATPTIDFVAKPMQYYRKSSLPIVQLGNILISTLMPISQPEAVPDNFDKVQMPIYTIYTIKLLWYISITI